MKHIDGALPRWSNLDQRPTPSLKPQAEEAWKGLREMRPDGVVPDADLKTHGFEVGVIVADKKEKKNLELIALGKDLKTVTLRPEGADESKDITIPRLQLLAFYTVCKSAEFKEYTVEQRATPSENCDLLSDVVKGAIKEKLMAMFQKSSEQYMTIRRLPAVSVVATKNFKEGTMELVGLTNRIQLLKTAALPQTDSNTCVYLGQCIAIGDCDYHAMAQCHLTFPKETQASGFAMIAVSPFMPSYWAVTETATPSEANYERRMEEVQLKYAGKQHTLLIPKIVNTKPLEHGQTLRVLKTPGKVLREDASQGSEPPKKLPRIAKAKGAKGRGKGKR